MSLEEREIRGSLSQRRFRSPAEAWPKIRSRLEEQHSKPSARGPILAAVAAVLLAAALWLRPAPASRPAARPEGFQVTRVESRGRPAAAMVLQPDRDTLMVLVSD